MRIKIGKNNLPVSMLNEFEISEISVKIPGSSQVVNVRLDNTDAVVFDKIFVDKEYDLGLPADVKAIIDCGANVGYSVAWFHTRFPTAKIIAIEPEPENFQRLVRNCGHLPNVYLIQAAVWAVDKPLSLRRETPEGRDLQSWGNRIEDTDGEDDTAGVCLNSIVKKFGISRIDILKIDIEGSEKEVFEAEDRRFIDIVDCLIIETHDRFKPGSNRAVVEAVKGDFYARRKGENQFFYKRLGPSWHLGGEKRNIWVVGDGRSGSTWFGNLVNCDSSFASYFEPLHSRKNPEFAGLPLISYFRPGTIPQNYVDFYRRVFAKRWSMANCGPASAHNSQVLVKDIHALMLAKALSEKLEGLEVVCIVRHPVSVARSKLKLNGWAWYREPALLLESRNLLEDWLLPFVDEIRQADTQFKKYVILWAIMHYVAKKQFAGNLRFVRYESDRSTLKAAIDDIRIAAGLEKADDGQFLKALEARSHTDVRGNDVSVPEADIVYAESVIRTFGLEELV